MAGRPPTRRLGHVPELDALRGVALLTVVAAHIWIVWPTWVFSKPFADGGFLAVDAFFVLSGFLITTLLLQEQARSRSFRLPEYYLRRALRVLPAIVLVLAAHLLYAAHQGYPPFGRSDWEWDTIRATLLFHMNWQVLWHPFAAADLTPLWSVAIEMQFYVLWPPVVVALLSLRRPKAVVLGFLITAFVAISLWRIVVFDRHGWEAAYLRSDSHIEGLVLGALVACAWVRGWTPERLPRWILWASLGVCALLVSQLKADARSAYTGGTTIFLFASAAALLVMVTHPRTEQGPVGRVLSFLGRVSYGIYLWHFPVLWAVTRDGTHLSDEQRLLLVIVITAVGVTVSRLCVEKPALAWRDRRARRAREGAPTDDAATTAPRHARPPHR